MESSADVVVYNSPNEDNPFSPENEKGLLCPLCMKEGIYFYCEDCIRNGSFTHSKDKKYERFAEKKLKLYELNERKRKLLQRFKEVFSSRAKFEDARVQYISYAQMNEYLQFCINSANKEITNTEMMIEDYRERNNSLTNRLLKVNDKIGQMEEKIKASRGKLLSNTSTLQELEVSMRGVRRTNIEQLVRYIFPISKTKINERNPYLDLDAHFDSVYVTGQWELAGGNTECEFQYHVVESTIPANGNYTAYTDWILRNSEEMNLTEDDQYLKDSADSIATALSLVSHLVIIIGYYLDAFMPKHLTHSEFSGGEFSQELFLHKVAKLNANVIHLCLSQNVRPSDIKPHHTLDNLMLLLEVDDLGTTEPMKTSQRLPQDKEDHLSSDLLSIDDREEGSNLEDLNSDWVRVDEYAEVDPSVVCEFGSLVNQPQL